MIIDFHTHVFPAYFRQNRSSLFPEEPAFESIYQYEKAKLVGVRELLRQMDEQGVQRSVIFGFPWEKEEHFRRHNDYVMNACQKHPDRLTGFCAFSPVSQKGIREVERTLKGGLSGVGELALYGSGLSPLVAETLGGVMDLCLRFEVPLLLHTNEPVGHHYPGKAPMTLREIYRFLKAYPYNRIVLAHWGGGILFYSLMKKEVREVLRNVWFDTAASPYLYRPEVYGIAGQIIGYEKILFGSDYPLLKPGRYFEEMARTDLSQQDMDKIKGANAARLLKLPV